MDQQNVVDANKFCCTLNNLGLKNHVNQTTHDLEHTLDLVTDCVEISIVESVYAEPQKTISNHMVINFEFFVHTFQKIMGLGLKFSNYNFLDVIDSPNHLITTIIIDRDSHSKRI